MLTERLLKLYTEKDESQLTLAKRGNALNVLIVIIAAIVSLDTAGDEYLYLL